MSLKDKIANAKETTWVTEGLDKQEVKSIVEIAKISAKIELARIDRGMTQIEFAEYMGVTQGMVSKWESREYNFTIKSLNDICEKLGLECEVSISDSKERTEFVPEKWEIAEILNISKFRVDRNLKITEGIA